MPSYTLQTTLCRCDSKTGEEYEFKVNVGFYYSPAFKAPSEGKWGPPVSPDDEESIEVESVEDLQGNEIELTDREQDSIEQQCWEYEDE